jgi:hypothetical protein
MSRRFVTKLAAEALPNIAKMSLKIAIHRR